MVLPVQVRPEVPDTMNQNELKKFVQDNPRLVSQNETSYPGLYVLKYKRRVFYDGLWNDFLEECRGTIVDKNFNVVSRPFTKIYNYGVEDRSPKLPDETKVTAFRKVNGFMVAMTWHNNNLLVSTTGSTNSPFVAMAKEFVTPAMSAVAIANQHSTLMFECVHRDDPHIVPEVEGLYFLGMREKKWESSVQHTFAGTMPDVFQVEKINTTVGELIALSKTVQHEGFVFYTEDGVSSKIKSPFYLVNKWLARNPRTDKLMSPEFKKQIDEEYYPLLAAIQNDIVAYTALTEQERLAWIRNFLEKQ